MRIPNDLRQKITTHFDIDDQDIFSDKKVKKATNEVYSFELKTDPENISSANQSIHFI
jgi:hypothetical protein